MKQALRGFALSLVRVHTRARLGVGGATQAGEPFS